MDANTLSVACCSAGCPPNKQCLQSLCWRVVLTLLVYTAFYAQPRGELHRRLIACLRHGHSTRMPSTWGTDRRGQIPDLIGIHLRPHEFETNRCRSLGRRLRQRCEKSNPPSAFWSNGPAAWCCSPRRMTLLPLQRERASPLNSIRLSRRYGKTFLRPRQRKSRHQELAAATCVKEYFCGPRAVAGDAVLAITSTGCCAGICLKAQTYSLTVKTNSTLSPATGTARAPLTRAIRAVRGLRCNPRLGEPATRLEASEPVLHFSPEPPPFALVEQRRRPRGLLLSHFKQLLLKRPDWRP